MAVEAVIATIDHFGKFEKKRIACCADIGILCRRINQTVPGLSFIDDREPQTERR